MPFSRVILEGYAHAAVREKAVKKIRDRVGTVDVPCWSSAGLHEVGTHRYIADPTPLALTNPYGSSPNPVLTCITYASH